jgi:hypothetical protein
MSTTMKKTYFELAKEAILTLKDRTGSSNQTIKAFIVNKYPSINFQQVTHNIIIYIFFITTYCLIISIYFVPH